MNCAVSSISLPAERHQRGIALVLALLVVALATIIAVNIMVSAEAQQRRTTLQLHGEQAWQYVLGAEQWVAQVLFRDKRDSATDHASEDWAVELPPLPVDGGMVQGRLEDLQGRFNLANLLRDDGTVDAAQLLVFDRLLVSLGVSDQLSSRAVIDFIDPNQEPALPDGAEDGHYLLQPQPYRTADRVPASVGELVLVRDMDPALLAVMAPHVVALPRRTPINVNAASAELVAALAMQISLPTAASVVAVGADGGFDSVPAFEATLGVSPQAGVPFSVQSDFFQLSVRVDIGTVQLTLYSLLERMPDGRTRVVARRRTPW